MHPWHPRQVFLIGQEQHHNKEEDEVSTQHHHHTEHVERKGHIGHQLVHVLDITVTEIRHILFQHFGSHLRLGIVARSFGGTISGESPDSRLSLFNLLLSGERGCTVFQGITAFQQVVDARHESL